MKFKETLLYTSPKMRTDILKSLNFEAYGGDSDSWKNEKTNTEIYFWLGEGGDIQFNFSIGDKYDVAYYDEDSELIHDGVDELSEMSTEEFLITTSLKKEFTKFEADYRREFNKIINNLVTKI
jgi:hypothetical protein